MIQPVPVVRIFRPPPLDNYTQYPWSSTSIGVPLSQLTHVCDMPMDVMSRLEIIKRVNDTSTWRGTWEYDPDNPDPELVDFLNAATPNAGLLAQVYYYPPENEEALFGIGLSVSVNVLNTTNAGGSDWARLGMAGPILSITPSMSFSHATLTIEGGDIAYFLDETLHQRATSPEQLGDGVREATLTDASDIQAYIISLFRDNRLWKEAGTTRTRRVTRRTTQLDHTPGQSLDYYALAESSVVETSTDVTETTFVDNPTQIARYNLRPSFEGSATYLTNNPPPPISIEPGPHSVLDSLKEITEATGLVMTTANHLFIFRSPLGTVNTVWGRHHIRSCALTQVRPEATWWGVEHNSDNENAINYQVVEATDLIDNYGPIMRQDVSRAPVWVSNNPDIQESVAAQTRRDAQRQSATQAFELDLDPYVHGSRFGIDFQVGDRVSLDLFPDYTWNGMGKLDLAVVHEVAVSIDGSGNFDVRVGLSSYTDIQPRWRPPTQLSPADANPPEAAEENTTPPTQTRQTRQLTPKEQELLGSSYPFRNRKTIDPEALSALRKQNENLPQFPSINRQKIESTGPRRTPQQHRLIEQLTPPKKSTKTDPHDSGIVRWLRSLQK